MLYERYTSKSLPLKNKTKQNTPLELKIYSGPDYIIFYKFFFQNVSVSKAMIFFFFLGLHNHHLGGTKFWRSGTQKWEFFIGVSRLNKVQTYPNLMALRPACDVPADPGRGTSAGQQTTSKGFRTELERRHSKGSGDRRLCFPA